MKLTRRPRSTTAGRIAAGLLAATILVPIAPAASFPLTLDPGRERPLPSATVTALERLRTLGAPKDLLRDVEKALRRPADEDYVFEGTIGFGLSAGDLDGDGREDVLATGIDYKITISFGLVPSLLFADVSYEGETRIEAVSGPDGRRLWRKKYDDLVLPLPARVGPKSRPGAYVLREIFSFLGPVEQYRLTIDALGGANGKPHWMHSYETQVVYQYPAFVARDAPLMLDVLDALPGRATDLVVGIGDVVWAGALYVDARAEVVDGRTGEVTSHPQHYRSVNWIPVPWKAGDLDRDGGDDYVVFTSPGTTGGGDATDIGTTALARNGRDGSAVWSVSPFDVRDIAWVYPLGHLTRDRVPDLGVVTADDRGDLQTVLVDGSDGSRLWAKAGAWPYAPGDVNRDGRRDVILRAMHFAWDKDEQRFVSAAHTPGGKRLWRRVIRQRFKRGSCADDFCWTWAWAGWQEVGDIEPDGVEDMWVTLGVEGDTTPLKVTSHTIAARTGKTLLQGGEGFLALDRPLVGRGTDSIDVAVDTERVQVTARRGNDGSRLWTTDLRTSGRWPRKDLLRFAQSAALTGGDCADLVLVVGAPKRSFLAAFNGRDGSVLWSRTLSGKRIDMRSENRAAATSCG